MQSKLVTAVLFALCGTPAAAQSFNLDFGEPGAGPSSSYAAAGLAGFWNAIHGDGTDVVLKNLAGVTSSVHFHQSGAAGLIAASDPALGGDDALLMNDGLITHTYGLDSCFYFTGLQPGTYELITYAWRPNTPSLMSKSFVDNMVGVEISGGAWPGHHVHGVTFARHIVTVGASQFMGPHSGLASGADPLVGSVCNGMQLRRIDPAGSAFCFGDGFDASHTSACPCGNVGTTGRGCANSVNPDGAHLDAFGTTSPDTIVLRAAGMPASAFGLYMQHDALDDRVFHDGVLCAGGTLIRLRGRASVAGESYFPDATDTVTLSQVGQVAPGSGLRRYYATWYRNASTTFCPPATANVTSGVLLDW